MSTDTDTLFDRRRLKKKLTIWRVAAIIMGAAFFISIISFSINKLNEFDVSNEHIAVLPINGFIGLAEKELEILSKIKDNDNAKALIIKVDSGGGTIVGSELLYKNIMKVAEKKPVIAVMNSVAASGGYIVSLACDKIYANENTITGSIGVIFQWPEVTKLLDNVGIKMHVEKNSKFKAAPSPFSTPDEDVIKVTRELIMDSHNWFLDIVSKRRKIDLSLAKNYGDGRVFNGRQAIKIDLIDKIGDFEDALEDLKKAEKLDDEIEIIDWLEINQDKPNFTDYLSGSLVTAFYNIFTDVSNDIVNKTRYNSQNGLQAIWQPSN